VGIWGRLAYSALDTLRPARPPPWTFHHHRPLAADTANAASPPIIPTRGNDQLRTGSLGFISISTTMRRSAAAYPFLCAMRDPAKAIAVKLSGSPAATTALIGPAGVYEIVTRRRRGTYLQINAHNCSLQDVRMSRTRSRTSIGSAGGERDGPQITQHGTETWTADRWKFGERICATELVRAFCCGLLAIGVRPAAGHPQNAYGLSSFRWWGVVGGGGVGGGRSCPGKARLNGCGGVVRGCVKSIPTSRKLITRHLFEEASEGRLDRARCARREGLRLVRWRQSPNYSADRPGRDGRQGRFCGGLGEPKNCRQMAASLSSPGGARWNRMGVGDLAGAMRPLPHHIRFSRRETHPSNGRGRQPPFGSMRCATGRGRDAGHSAGRAFGSRPSANGLVAPYRPGRSQNE